MHGFSSSERVRIPLDDRSYDIAIGTGLLDDPRHAAESETEAAAERAALMHEGA